MNIKLITLITGVALAIALTGCSNSTPTVTHTPTAKASTSASTPAPVTTRDDSGIHPLTPENQSVVVNGKTLTCAPNSEGAKAASINVLKDGTFVCGYPASQATIDEFSGK